MFFAAQAQNEIDALRYSMLNPGGTARFVSTGGAFSALGGDFSTLSTNPAGIAVYRSNEFTITPSLNFTNVNSSFMGTPEEDINYDFTLSNIGFVFSFNDPNALKETGWLGFQFGFGLNNLMNFNSRRIYEGFNTQNSLMSAFLDKANIETDFNSMPNSQNQLDDYTTGLAWDSELLFINPSTNEYEVDMLKDVLQKRSTHTSGSIRELNLSFGANYSNRLYMGASLGFPIIRFEKESTFTEEDSKGNDIEFNSLEFGETFKTRGTGFNFKIGAIFRATDMIRLAAAVHTPTFYNLEDTWQTNMQADLVNFGIRDSVFFSKPLLSEYELTTPFKLTGGLGLVFGTTGLLSFDYEYADYTQMRLRSDGDLNSDQNKTIKSGFQQQHVIRAGGEIRLNPIVLRAGYAIHSNPYNDNITTLEKSTISAGLGIREQSYFIDFGYFISQYTEEFFQYYNLTGNRESAVNYDLARQGFMMTVGFRF